MKDIEDLRILLTAAEAYPAFEERVAAAQVRITASFRIFDPFTRLRTRAGRAYGTHWFDLLAGKLREGVEIDLAIADFDPVAKPGLHRQTWASMRAFWALAEASGACDGLRVRANMHPARTGRLPTFLLWPHARRRIRTELARLSRLPEAERQEALRLSPALMPLLKDDGRRVRFWPPVHYVPASHHQKIAVIDDEWLYMGGLDLDERRYDSIDHERPAEETWHDVQMLVRGRVVADALRHLREFEAVTAGRQPPSQLPGPFLRTLSAPRRHGAWASLSPKTVASELFAVHIEGIASARRVIYIETQFLRDSRIAAALGRAARERPDLRVIIVLPAAPEDVAFLPRPGPDARYGEYLQARAVARLTTAFGGRLFLAAPAQPARQQRARTRRDHLDGAPIIYVHAKIAVFDNAWAVVSSANLNGRSMSWDTECGLRLDDPGIATHLLQRCLDHWSAGQGPAATDEPAHILETLRARAYADRARDPDQREGLLLPYRVAPARRFGRNLPGIPEGMV
ncbi:Phospholipase D/Transphosphatidylase [Oceanicola granulosus HTCC2516]|uniref:Phospholipase D n=1 Tax=Oceanicola granulosus (strain ATCC BAA-861 / DSM 15982 / KCTC 12143 / HTCC2516) TaxID=314256 RepID=Q2CIU5_OCEGH|nr:phospholipase D-like domain-containing protein [Oceanicola granulosus]EAR52494.1 Phospholipase D/Transphosphatidylase [Oceanicola granulosus HTCC2516]